MPHSDFDVVTGPSMQQPRTQAPPAEQTNRLPEPATEPSAPSRTPVTRPRGRGKRR